MLISTRDLLDLTTNRRSDIEEGDENNKEENKGSSSFYPPIPEYGIEVTERPNIQAPGWMVQDMDGAGDETCVPRGRNSCPARGREVSGSAQGGYETAAKVRDQALITLRGKGGGREVDEESKGGYVGAAAAQHQAAKEAAAWTSRFVSRNTQWVTVRKTTVLTAALARET
ncbi:hypothetical protein CP532_3637 [Ophiocordyceps camponoti-leonardi (nom. inval.)]|nr:hypothetical protein CP532_3637 [Ophiocordyceps camponoti-leonardi (nom. inval.)]